MSSPQLCPWLPLPGWYGCAHAWGTGQAVVWSMSVSLALKSVQIEGSYKSYVFFHSRTKTIPMFSCKLPLTSLKWIWRHCTPSAFTLAKDLAKISSAFVLSHSLRKQSTFGDATTGIPAKWHLRLNRAQKFRTFDALLARAWWCFWLVSDLFHPIRSTTDLLVVMRHQYGVFALVSQTSFPEETSGGVAKFRLSSQSI